MVLMSYIRKYRRGNSTYVQLVFKEGRRIKKVIHLGTAHTEIELNLLLIKAEQIQVGEKQQALFPISKLPANLLVDSTSSKLLHKLITENYADLGFDEIGDKIFKHLVVARIVEPVSKLDSIRILEDMGQMCISKDQIYRSLLKTTRDNYRKILEKLCRKKCKINNYSVLLYDVTTLYFETPKEDEKRISGLSKERRLEPQIVVGLLVDQSGFPLSLQMFAGNVAETKTIVPVLQGFKKDFPIKNLTVVADAAMLNQKNITEIIQNGFHYIIGSRQHKMPFAIEEYLTTNKTPIDLDIVESTLSKDDHEQRAIYQYRAKRAQLDLKNIEKQIRKAENVIAGIGRLKKNKFVTLNLRGKKLNQDLIKKAKLLAGFKGYITNLDLPAREIIRYYHDLWHVEASFRMSKSDLKARPIFHRKEESIEAHLTIVMAAMAVAKLMEEKSGMAIRRVIKLLRPLRTCVLLNTATGSKTEIPPHILEDHAQLIKKISRGY